VAKKRQMIERYMYAVLMYMMRSILPDFFIDMPIVAAKPFLAMVGRQRTKLECKAREKLLLED